MDSIQELFLVVITSYIFVMGLCSLIISLFGFWLNCRKDYTRTPKVSVLMSAFNEGEAVYRTIESLRKSNYPVDLLQIVALDDRSSDDTFYWLQKASIDFDNVTIKQNAKNQGKGLTLLDAALLSDCEYIIGVDSDCVFHPDAVRELMACFSEPGIGAVGGIVKVANARSSILARAQGVFYANSYYLFKTVENAFRKVQCLSGPIVSMRKDVFLKMSDEVSSRNFLGLSITNGEDRALTQMLLRNGYGTYVNFNAKCWTNVPETFDQYLKQQLRWRKSAIGQWVEAITKYRKYSPINIFLSILPISMTLLWMLLIITSLLTYNFMPILLSVVVFHISISPILASIYWYVNHKDPYEAIDTPIPFVLAMVIASFWFPISGLLVGMFAACSLDDGSWITRSNT